MELTKKLKNYLKKLPNFVKKRREKTTLSTIIESHPDTRICSKCKEEKPLDKDHYQVVRYFKTGFSYYCNDCDK